MARLKLQHGSKRRTPPAMARVKKQRQRVVEPRPAQEGTFLPSHEHLVKMIAMQGADDDEIADMFDVPRAHFAEWRKRYPSFNKALNEGRLPVDAEVTYALYKQTQGFTYEEETATPKGGIVKVKRFSRPDTSAQKYWLENRRPDLWKTASTTRHAGAKGEDPIGVKVETRDDLIDAIVGLIVPKPDGNAKPAEDPADRIKR